MFKFLALETSNFRPHPSPLTRKAPHTWNDKEGRGIYLMIHYKHLSRFLKFTCHVLNVCFINHNCNNDSSFHPIITGGQQHSPPGQSAGLAVASALVTLGNPRRPSIEHPKEPKTKRKQSQHPDSCI